MKTGLSIVALALTVVAPAAYAAPIEQIDCPVSALTEDEWRLFAGAMTEEDAGPDEAMAAKFDAAIEKCAAKYGWNETDKDNAARNAAIKPAVAMVGDQLPAEHKAIVDRYFDEHGARLATYPTNDEKMLEESMLGLVAAGLPKDDEETMTSAGLYFSMRVVSLQLRNDFVAGVLRD